MPLTVPAVPELPAPIPEMVLAPLLAPMPEIVPAELPPPALPVLLLPLVPGVIALIPFVPVLVRREPVLIGEPLCGSDGVICPRISPSGKAVECTLK
jgi:hypothetical protein